MTTLYAKALAHAVAGRILSQEPIDLDVLVEMEEQGLIVESMDTPSFIGFRDDLNELIEDLIEDDYEDEFELEDDDEDFENWLEAMQFSDPNGTVFVDIEDDGEDFAPDSEYMFFFYPIED